MESVDFGQHENQGNQLALTEHESNSVQGALFMRHWELIRKRMNTTGYLRGLKPLRDACAGFSLSGFLDSTAA